MITGEKTLEKSAAAQKAHTEPVIIPQIPEKILCLKSGRKVRFRKLARNDESLLFSYLQNLSDQSRGWFKPHKFDAETVHNVCVQLEKDSVLRMIAEPLDSSPEFIVYFLLYLGLRPRTVENYASYGIDLHLNAGCELAPSISDACQNTGLGSLIMTEMIRVAEESGRKQIVLWGGVNAWNSRAVHFYKKFGFVTVHLNKKMNKKDMILNLNRKEGRV